MRRRRTIWPEISRIMGRWWRKIRIMNSSSRWCRGKWEFRRARVHLAEWVHQVWVISSNRCNRQCSFSSKWRICISPKWWPGLYLLKWHSNNQCQTEPCQLWWIVYGELHHKTHSCSKCLLPHRSLQWMDQCRCHHNFLKWCPSSSHFKPLNTKGHLMFS